jgi:hypothetical protein
VAGTRKFKQSGGEEVEAEVVGFRAAGEHWNEYLLDDGTVFKIKLVVTGSPGSRTATTRRAIRSTPPPTRR